MSSPTDTAPVLAVQGLVIAYGRHGQFQQAVKGVDFSLAPGETVAIVGESGSGKTSVANAVLGLLPAGGQVQEGRIDVMGQNIVGAKERVLRQVRGRVIGLVPQDPMVSLNPTMRIGQQIGETVRLRGVNKRSVPAEVIEALELAGLDNPILRARQYPHQLSGGMRQRALIANALAGKPKILVADEPTSALDATVQRKMLDHLEYLVKDAGISLLLITHDLAVASDRADRILVMQHGRVVEVGTSEEVLEFPKDPYTKRLLAAAPGISVLDNMDRPRVRAASVVEAPDGEGGRRDPILRLENIVKEFHLPGGRGQASVFRALDGVSLDVPRGQTLALVGESGSGKTTAMRVAMRLETPSSGTVIYDGTDITSLSWRRLRTLRQGFQLVHQDPFSSLDPKFTIQDSIVEPLVSFGIGSSTDRVARARELLGQVNLPESFLTRRPAELSGGQRQRVAIARALALKPNLVLLDEPVSALDVSVQAQILDLLATLQRELALSYFFITHDLAIVAEIADEVAVMSAGRIIETGTTRDIFTNPQSEQTQQLIEAIPGQRRRAATG